MVNERFMEDYDTAKAVFLPNGISDHCPGVVNFPSYVVRRSKHKPFRFANHITEKPEFLDIVKEEWGKSNIGEGMGKVMIKLKKLKYHMKKHSWKRENVFEKVKELKIELKNIQQLVNNKPFDLDLRKKASGLLKEYMESLEDEEKILAQKAKMDWLQPGDKNNAFFSQSNKRKDD